MQVRQKIDIIIRPNKINYTKGEKMATLRQSVLRLQAAGIISDSTAKTLFNRVRKQEEKQVRQERQNRVNQTVAFYIGNNWQKGQGYRVKATEIALRQHGITRKELETAMKTLHSKGLLTHNKDQVKNNCHVQWRLPVTEEDGPVFGSN
jgi:predicted transcriptional regulator